MNRLRIRTDGDVLRDHAEMRAGLREAPLEIGFARKLVLEHIQIGHAQSVEAGGLEKSVVPLERVEALPGAFAIEGFEKLALGIISLQLRAGVRGEEKKKRGGEEKCGGEEKL